MSQGFSDSEIHKLFDEFREKAESELFEVLEGRIETAANLAIDGLYIDGSHHKQYYLEQILDALNYNLLSVRDSEGEWEPGIPG